jgi:hypothetical protein
MAMTQDEAVTALNKVNETLVKIGDETDKLLKDIEELNAALAEAIAAGNTITPRLEAAIAATGVRADSIDSKVPDVRPPE